MDEPLDDSLHQARLACGLEGDQLWLRYFFLGGMRTALELDALCHGLVTTAPLDRDRVVHALNERLVELGREPDLPYESD